jgi:hypothetical protein
MFWTGLVVGVFVGMAITIFTLCLCIGAGSADREIERMVESNESQD